MLWRRFGISCIAGLVLASWAQAQVPPAAPAAAAAAPAPAAVAGAADVGFCEKCWIACETCKRRLCEMPLGAMINGMTKPFSAMSGGIIPQFCPITPSKEDLAKPGVEGAAAQAKADALAAKARRLSVRYLGTMDCRYYPEAEVALIAALRTDGVECVRWEAAMALGRSCCCTKKIIDALTVSVSCSEADGNPAELSERVRMAAAVALDRCLACYVEVVEVPEKVIDNTKEKLPPLREPLPGDRGAQGAVKPSRRPDKQSVLAGREALKKFYGQYGVAQQTKLATENVRVTPVATTPQVPVKQASLPPVAATKPMMEPAKRQEPRSLFGVIRDSMGSSRPSATYPTMTTGTEAIITYGPEVATVTTPGRSQPTMPGQMMMPNAVAASKINPATLNVAPPQATPPAPPAANEGTMIIFDPPAPPAPKK